MNRSGLTLVEILVAITIIAAVFMVLANSQIASLQVTRDSQLASIATQVANNAMERASKLFLDNYFSCSGIDCNGTFEDIVVRGNSYQAAYTIEVMDYADPVLAGLALVTVTVAEPRPIVFAQYVSCLDISPPPTFDNPGPCEN